MFSRERLCFLHQTYNLIQFLLCFYVQCLKFCIMVTLKMRLPNEHSDKKKIRNASGGSFFHLSVGIAYFVTNFS